MKNIITKAGMALLIAGISACAFAQEEAPAHSVYSYFRYMPKRSVDAQPGDVKIVESGIEYLYEFKAFGKLPVALALDNSYMGIEDSVANVELPAHLSGLSAGVETTVPFFHFNKTYFRVRLSPSFFGEDLDFSSSAFRLLSRYYIIYQPQKKWTFLYGIAVYPDFEYEALPIIGLIYKPNDKLAFNLIPTRPNITYAFTDRLSVFADGSAALDEYEVTRNNQEGVVLRYRERRMGGGVKFKINEYVQASLSGGGVFNRRFKYRDSQGKVSVKDGAYGEFRLEMKI